MLLLKYRHHYSDSIPDGDRIIFCENRIIVKGKSDVHSLVFTIDNTFENEIHKDNNGHLLTTKLNGSGIGVSSAQKIVEQYGGIFSVEQKDSMFCVSFMLNF